MKRQNYNMSVVPDCCVCHRLHNISEATEYSSADRRTVDSNECFCKCKNCPRSRQSEYYTRRGEEKIDEHTMQALSAMRQKACRFLNSESDYSSASNSTFQPCTCNQTYQSKSESPVKKMQGNINYNPQSEFLKKMKGQESCLCPNNSRARESFSTNNNLSCAAIPRMYEECVAKSNEIITLLQEINNRTVETNRTANESYNDNPPAGFNLGFMNNFVRSCRNIVDELKVVADYFDPNVNEEHPVEPQAQKIDTETPAINSKTKPSKTKEKYQHVSRSKKRVRCRGGKKRKSNDNAKSASQECFEPSLKRPHENSCERCWRYASPARSPVNKPDQRYNPNFRRASSWHELTTSEAEKNYTPENLKENLSPKAAALSPTTTTSKVKLKCNCGTSGDNAPKVKEFLGDVPSEQTHYQLQTPKENIAETDYLNQERPARPKSYSPGTRNYPSFFYDSEIAPKIPSTREIPVKQSNTKRVTRSKNVQNQNSEGLSERNFSPRYFSTSKISSVPKPTGLDDSLNASINLRLPRNFTRSYRNEDSEFDSHLTTQRVPSSLRNLQITTDCPYHKNGHKTFAMGNDSVRSFVPRNQSPMQERIQTLPRTQSSVIPPNMQKAANERRNQVSDYNTQYLPSGRYQNQSPALHDYRSCQCNCTTNQPYYEENVYPNAPNQFRRTPEEHAIRLPKNVSTPKSPAVNERYWRNIQQPLKSDSIYYSPRQDSRMRSDLGDFPIRRAPGPNRQNIQPEYYRNQNCDCGKPNYMAHEVYPQDSWKNSNKNQYPSYYNQFAPKQYSVFYMTKNKNDKGHEVEVLVEELTEKNNKNEGSKATEIKNKMKKMHECPSDSMALRFQKGASDFNRTPENGRVLYF